MQFHRHCLAFRTIGCGIYGTETDRVLAHRMVAVREELLKVWSAHHTGRTDVNCSKITSLQFPDVNTYKLALLQHVDMTIKFMFARIG